MFHVLMPEAAGRLLARVTAVEWEWGAPKLPPSQAASQVAVPESGCETHWPFLPSVLVVSALCVLSAG